MPDPSQIHDLFHLFFSSINSMGWDESRDQTRPFNDFTSLGSICPTEGG